MRGYIGLMVIGIVGYVICFIFTLTITLPSNANFDDYVTYANISRTVSYVSFFTFLGFMIGSIGAIVELTSIIEKKIGIDENDEEKDVNSSPLGPNVQRKKKNWFVLTTIVIVFLFIMILIFVSL